MGSRTSNTRPSKRRLSLWVKAAVTVTLYGVLFWLTDWVTLGATLGNANLWLVGVVAAMMFGSVTLSAYKWRLILRIHSLDFSLVRLQRYYFVAMFFNNFLPSSIGGDGYRVFKTFDNPRGKLYALVAVVVERLTGFAALMLLGYLAAIVMFIRTGDEIAETVTSVETLVGLGCLVGLLVMLSMRRLRRHLPTQWIPAKLLAVTRFVGDYRQNKAMCMRVVSVSFLFQLWNLALYWLLLHALGSHVTMTPVMLFLGLAGIVAFLPITLNGIGLTDGAFIYLAVHYGVSYEVALSCMLLIRGINLLVSAVGAWFYFTGEPARPPRELTLDPVCLPGPVAVPGGNLAA